MSFIDNLLGKSRLVVGVERDPHGCRLFLDARYRGRYVLVADPKDVEECVRAWETSSGHIYAPVPFGYPTITHYDTVAANYRSLINRAGTYS